MLRSRSDPLQLIAPSVASANGAPPSSTGFIPSSRWCITGLATSVIARTSSALAPISAVLSLTSVHSASLTTRVMSASPPGFIMTYETRLMRSSPKRICGFMMPLDASTSPVIKSHRCAAMVVEPTSTATPSVCSLKPGHTAMTRWLSATATVTFQSSWRRAGCSIGRIEGSMLSSLRCHSYSSAVSRRCISPLGVCISGSCTST